MIIDFTKEEIKERDSFEASYERLLKELELKIDSLRPDPEPDKKKLAENERKLRALKPPKRKHNPDDSKAEWEYLTSPEYKAYLEKNNAIVDEYGAIIKEWEDAGPEEWKAARKQYDELEKELNATRDAFIKRCAERQFKALGGDLQKIYKDACRQAARYIEMTYAEYERKLDDGTYTGFQAIDVRAQEDGSFKLDREETRKNIYKTIERHIEALKDDAALTGSLKEYIEQILKRNAHISTEGKLFGKVERPKEKETATGDVLATRPTDYVTTVDRVSRLIFGNIKSSNGLIKPIDAADSATFGVALNRAGTIKARVAIDYKDLLQSGEIAQIPKLNEKDYNVHDAIITLLNAGNRTMTYDMIYRAMTGKVSGKIEIPDSARQAIDEALSKFRGTLKLKYEYKNDQGELVTRYFDEPLVSYVRVKEVTVNGKIIAAAIRLSDDTKFDPPLLKWAKLNGNEIDTRDITLLDVPKLNNGDESFTIKMCLYRRIIGMRNAFDRIKKGRSELDENERTIRYDYVYEALGLEEPDKRKRTLVKDKIDRCLQYWTEKGLIAGYEHKKDKAAGNAYYASVVSFIPAK